MITRLNPVFIMHSNLTCIEQDAKIARALTVGIDLDRDLCVCVL